MVETDEHTQESIRHELSDLSAKNIALFAVALSAIILLVLLAAYGLFRRFAGIQMRAQPPPSPLKYTREPAPGPHLQADPRQELKEMRAAEDSVLTQYGWIDAEKGIVRIPIDRAMQILAQKGLPTRATTDEGQQGAASNKPTEQEPGKAQKEQKAR